ncbi:hypothetical protein PAPYR_1636 [Paratrimastix pyriformis]|uniref:Uncharacterized protein n=1 Tax=Paratrimastix pyriformis TaxID=342808 RepID=A0ABQ8US27_9EUKA|nr:hypothetical protein PAPYR_1636 [Paratrimastix pyriformis]
MERPQPMDTHQRQPDTRSISDRAKQTVKTFFDSGNIRNEDFAENCVFHRNSNLGIINKDIAFLFLGDLQRAFGPIGVHERICECNVNNLVCLWYKIILHHEGNFRGTGEPTHKSCISTWVCFLRYDDNHRIAEVFWMLDIDSVKSGLGIRIEYPTGVQDCARSPSNVVAPTEALVPGCERNYTLATRLLSQLSAWNPTGPAQVPEVEAFADSYLPFRDLLCNSFHNISFVPRMCLCDNARTVMLCEMRCAVYREFESLPTTFFPCRCFCAFSFSHEAAPTESPQPRFFAQIDTTTLRAQCRMVPLEPTPVETTEASMLRLLYLCELGCQNVADFGQVVWHDMCCHALPLHLKDRFGGGVHALTDMLHYWNEKCEGLKLRVIHLVASPNFAAAYLSISGKNRSPISGSQPTYRRFTVPGALFAQAQQGRFRQLWFYFDIPAMYRHLGIPLPTAEKLYTPAQHHVVPCEVLGDVERHNLTQAEVLWHFICDTNKDLHQTLRPLFNDNVTLVTHETHPFFDFERAVTDLQDSRAPFGGLRAQVCLAVCNATSCALWLRLTGHQERYWMGAYPEPGGEKSKTFATDCVAFYRFDPREHRIVNLVHLRNRVTKAIELGVDNGELFAAGSLQQFDLAAAKARQRGRAGVHVPPPAPAPVMAPSLPPEQRAEQRPAPPGPTPPESQQQAAPPSKEEQAVWREVQKIQEAAGIAP